MKIYKFYNYLQVSNLKNKKSDERNYQYLITILAGGTGSTKLVRGIFSQIKNINIISNVADNFWHHGLYVCPDIDTIIYGLSNNLDLKKGWGIKKDSFNFLKQMTILGEETWFSIGDKDLATHIIRTKMLKEGKKLNEITKFFVKKYNIPINVIPASESHYETRMLTKDGKNLHLQEFWVKYRGTIPISDIKYNGIEKVKLNLEIKRILEGSKLIIISPGNPITSIGPIININGMKKLLQKLKNRVVMVSPLISNKSFSGPCQMYMKAKNVKPDITGIISLYSSVTKNMIFDQHDKKEIENTRKKNQNINFYYTDINMNTLKKEYNLGKFIISNFYK